VQTNLLNVVASGNYSIEPGNTTPYGSNLAAKAKCTFSVTFTPTNKGTIKGAITITDDAPTSPQTVGLTGTGQ